jgi:hypothetical protein
MRMGSQSADKIEEEGVLGTRTPQALVVGDSGKDKTVARCDINANGRSESK